MRLLKNTRVSSILPAFVVGGFAFWWYSKPYPLFGIAAALVSAVFIYAIFVARHKEHYQRGLLIALFIVFLGTILSIVFVDNTLAAFMDWASRHTIAYYKSGESLRSTLFPCTLTISQVFLGDAAYFKTETGSWMTTFPTSLNAFYLVMVPFAATVFLFGRSICGWICPFGGLPEAMATGRKQRWQLNFLKRKDSGTGLRSNGLLGWVADVKYGVLLASMLLAIFFTFPVVCLFCPVLWLTAMPAFWTVMGLMLVFAIALPLMTKKRWWCQICPLGAFFATLDKISFFRVRVNRNRCDRCMDCVHECRMYALTASSVDITGKPNEDCIRCGRCIEVCPEKAMDVYFMGTSRKVRPVFITLATSVVLAWYIWFIFIFAGRITNAL
jgi:NAD-dependent dihydropyrimidine dehydrogenase PreA subunit